MKPHDFMEEEIRNICNIIILVASDKMCLLGEPINNYLDGFLLRYQRAGIEQGRKLSLMYP